MSTAAEILVGLSGLASGSAALHLMAITAGGGTTIHVGPVLDLDATQPAMTADAGASLSADNAYVTLSANAAVEAMTADINLSITAEA